MLINKNRVLIGIGILSFILTLQKIILPIKPSLPKIYPTQKKLLISSEIEFKEKKLPLVRKKNFKKNNFESKYINYIRYDNRDWLEIIPLGSWHKNVFSRKNLEPLYKTNQNYQKYNRNSRILIAKNKDQIIYSTYLKHNEKILFSEENINFINQEENKKIKTLLRGLVTLKIPESYSCLLIKTNNIKLLKNIQYQKDNSILILF